MKKIKIKEWVLHSTENPSHSFSVSPVIFDHTVLLCYQTCEQPHLNYRQIGWYSVCLCRRDGRLS